jgi:hypothetical protein
MKRARSSPLWSIARSPLVLGANLTRKDNVTESLLTNPEVIAVDQQSSANKPVIQTPTTVVWTAKGAAGKQYVGVFNLGDTEQTISYAWKDLGFNGSHYKLRDLWQKKDLDAASALKVTLPPHASALYSIR